MEKVKDKQFIYYNKLKDKQIYLKNKIIKEASLLNYLNKKKKYLFILLGERFSKFKKELFRLHFKKYFLRKIMSNFKKLKKIINIIKLQLKLT